MKLLGKRNYYIPFSSQSFQIFRIREEIFNDANTSTISPVTFHTRNALNTFTPSWRITFEDSSTTLIAYIVKLSERDIRVF